MGFPVPCWACTPPTGSTSKSARIKSRYFIIGNAAPPIDALLASLHMGKAVKPHVIATCASHHQMAKKPRKVRHIRRRNRPLRSHLIALLLFVAAASGLGCASQDPAARAAEHAAQASEDDATCRQKGAEDSKAYEECRKGLAEAQARQSAVQEQKRRDFDRVLGAGTDGQNSY